MRARAGTVAHAVCLPGQPGCTMFQVHSAPTPCAPFPCSYASLASPRIAASFFLALFSLFSLFWPGSPRGVEA